MYHKFNIANLLMTNSLCLTVITKSLKNRLEEDFRTDRNVKRNGVEESLKRQ